MKSSIFASLLCAAFYPSAGAETKTPWAKTGVADSKASSRSSRPSAPPLPADASEMRPLTQQGDALAPAEYQAPEVAPKDHVPISELEDQADLPDISEVREATRISEEIIRGKKALKELPPVSGSAGLLEIEDQRLGAVVGLPLAPVGDRVKREKHPHLQPLDPEGARKQLQAPPRVAIRPALVPRPAAATEDGGGNEGAFIPSRKYFPNRDAVVVVEEGVARELSYVTLPVLFVTGTAELLDKESREALVSLGEILVETAERDSSARFVIEGHTSTEGKGDDNLQLSAARAKRIFDELTQRYEVPAYLLDARGFGENYPNNPQGDPSEAIKDMRILVVRAE